MVAPIKRLLFFHLAASYSDSFLPDISGKG
jgi:hypothetical protein